jgi:hypothetical protein
MRLAVELLLLELIISGLRPLPVSSAQIVLLDSEQSYVSDQNSNFLPVIFNSFEFPVTKIYCMGDSLTEAGVYETELMALLGSDWSTINLAGPATRPQICSLIQADVMFPAMRLM